MGLTNKFGRKYIGVLITLFGLVVIAPLLLGSSELPSNQTDRKEAELQVNSFYRFDSLSSVSLGQLVNVPYDAVKRGEREIGKNEVFREYGRNISNSIVVRDHYFVVGNMGIEIPMLVSNPTMFLNFMADKYVPNYTLENIVINGDGLYGIDIAKLDEDSPAYDPLESKRIRDGLLKSSDLDVILPYYYMSLDEFMDNDIRYSFMSIDVSGLTGLDMAEARLKAISRYNFEAKKIASLELINDVKSNDHYTPKAFFWHPVSYDVNTQSVELLVGVIDLKMPEYANY